MKTILFVSLMMFGSLSYGQQQEKTLAIKTNLATLPIGMLDVGIEKKLNEHYSVQANAFLSPWKSWMGKHAQIYLAGLDVRYYFSQVFEKFYLGANLTGGFYDVQKWNYWNESPYVHKNGDETSYISSNLYQRGYTIVFGAVGGYQFVLNEHWNLDAFLGIGNMQSFYRGYDKISGDRYDDEGDRMGRDLNRSGEWLPYRAGLMLTYKL